MSDMFRSLKIFVNVTPQTMQDIWNEMITNTIVDDQTIFAIPRNAFVHMEQATRNLLAANFM